MEGNLLKGMPKFNNPEEELNFLREHVAKREQELKDSGHFEHAKEYIVHEVISEYKEIPANQAVHKDIILNKQIFLHFANLLILILLLQVCNLSFR